MAEKRGYTRIPQTITHDDNLTCTERGLLVTLLSLPPNWKFSIRGLATILPESEKKITSILNFLETKGYITRIRIQDSKGRFNYEWKIYDKSQKPAAGNRSVEIAQKTSDRIMDNPQLNNTFVHSEQITEPEIVNYPLSKNPVPDKPLPGKQVSSEPVSGFEGQLSTNEVNPHNINPHLNKGSEEEDESLLYHLINKKMLKMYGMSQDAAKVYDLLIDEFDNVSIKDREYHQKLAGMGESEIDHIYREYCSNRAEIRCPDNYIRKVIRNTALNGYKPASEYYNNTPVKQVDSKRKYHSGLDYDAMVKELGVIGRPSFA